ncbi:pilus assembly protein [[Acidovorax] ebreus]|uniref:Type 4 fimbrial biogenesis protein PilY1 n=1 Tax=Acidovorax ebreus (strain TPSY) TaxID=535289 RepID=A0A9J9QA87_ACIET|nr:PilC/PilY family type IV pilus protein [[Acidovorax] ebreus]ACM33974.1 type 4 fimbrial biogenesis protein PilY1 [[Acidovorax] ebreus TPSY]
MTFHAPSHTRFKKTLLASLIGAALAPHTALALDFAQAPPGTVEPYVAPNVILSLDDSGSMNTADMTLPGVLRDPSRPYCNRTGGCSGGNAYNPWVTAPQTLTRTKVLADALKDTFSDTALLPNGKIRMAWQSMNNSTTGSGLTLSDLGTAAATNGTSHNMMRVLDATHRANFIAYANKYSASGNTPTHRMVQRADDYMRATPHQNGPWADVPGTKLADAKNDNKPLGCRRNYHILLTDGGWNQYVQSTTPLNYDNRTSPDLPNGKPYTATAQTRLYRDSEDFTTIADWAFQSWANPLRPATDLHGKVSPLPEYDNAPASETITNRVTKTTATLEKFWNPKYDPADWAHMVTFTIGFSTDALPQKNYSLNKDGTSVTDQGAITAPTTLLPYGDDGNLADYANGTYTWRAYGGSSTGTTVTSTRDRGHDMWHAALNGRGRFYAVEKGEDLKEAFRQIVRTINAETEPDRGSTATSGSNASQNDVGIFTASYVPKEGWRGAVSSETFKSDDGTTVQAWDGKTTADKLDDTAFNVTNRLVLTWNDDIPSGSTAEVGGRPFKWTSGNTNLSADQKVLLTATGTNGGPSGTAGADGNNRVNYLRGVRDLECPDAGCTTDKPFRKRWSRQGSIINSEVWYLGAPTSNYALEGYTAFTRTWAKREPMLYVGGNDGMLHGFTAADGTERIAYVPRGVMRDLPKLTNPTFNNNHQYFVDGSPMTGDVFDSEWKTLLIGTLGAGGRGYFVLDVTNPGKTDGTGSSNFTETNANSLVVMDKTLPASTTTASNDDVDDLGHIFAKPVMDDANPQRTTQIVRMNDNRWAAVMGNGYNSANGRPVLLIQYLDGAKELLRIPALTTDTDNGLSAPRLVDISGDGRPDVVYAGDLKGNLWKFLINTEDASQWGVATWEGKAAGTPLFTANRGTGHSANTNSSTRQSITAAPSARVNDRTKTTGTGTSAVTGAVGGMMVAFGTGRNVTKLDQAELQQQTLYSVLDNTRYEREMTGTAPNEKPTGRVKVCATTTGVCAKLVKSSDDLPHAVAQSDLVQSTIPDTAAQTRDGRSFWKLNASTLNWADKKGWFMDFPLTRERLLKPMQFYDGSNLLMVPTQIPAKGSRLDPAIESCEGGAVDKESQYVTFINIMDGQAPRVPIIDGPNGLARYGMPPGALTMIVKGNRIHMRGRQPKQGGTGSDLVEEKMRRMPEMSLRPNWRQLK